MSLPGILKKVNMQFAVTKEHLDFYYQNGYIEFDEVLKVEEIDTLKDAVEETLSKRMAKKKGGEWTEREVFGGV